MHRTLSLAVLAGLIAAPAFASSDNAWAEFRAEVEAKCQALVEAPEGAKVQVEVSPEGSQNYGAALVTVGLPAGGAERMVCIMDKQARTAELSTPLPATEGESAAVGGGMGKAQTKGDTAGDDPAPTDTPPAPKPKD